MGNTHWLTIGTALTPVKNAPKPQIKNRFFARIRNRQHGSEPSMRSHLLLLLSWSLVFAGQACAAQWARTYGGAGDDYARVVQPTTDGGYIVAGFTNSFGAGGFDAWVLRLDGGGNILWQKTYGGSTDDYATTVAPTSDGGFFVGGTSQGLGFQGFPYVGWVLKLDAGGNLLREDRYGGTNSYSVVSVESLPDGGYTLAGDSHPFPASGKVWLLRADSAGNVVWERVFGGGFDDRAYDLHLTSDGGYVLAGRIVAAGGANSRVMKLDSTGTVTWQRFLISPGQNEALAVQPADDGGYVISGPTIAFGAGNGDAWVVKLDASGTVLWQKTYGGAAYDTASDLRATGDGGFVVAGNTRSFGAGQDDIWLLKLSATGSILWQRTFGGAAAERAYSVRATSDGGLIVAGETQSFGAGNVDVWLLRLGPTGGIGECAAVGDSNAAVAESNSTIAVVTTTLIPWSAAPLGANATYAGANALSHQQCYFDAPLPVAAGIETLSGWALNLLSSLLVLLGAIALWSRRLNGAKI